MLQGTLCLQVGERDHTLEVDDAMYFDSDVPHAYRRTGARRCSALVITAPLSRRSSLRRPAITSRGPEVRQPQAYGARPDFQQAPCSPEAWRLCPEGTMIAP